jgi:hypothetical protein
MKIKKDAIWLQSESELDSLDYSNYKYRVVVSRDEYPEAEIDEEVNIFLFWSNYEKRISSDRSAENPYQTDVDGNVSIRPGLVAFKVNAYIHSSIALSLSEFSDPWDSINGVGVLYTTKERYEKFLGYDSWDTEWSEQEEKMVKVPNDKFLSRLKKVAEIELHNRQKIMLGDVWCFSLEEINRFKKIYASGEESEGIEFEPIESVCGYVCDDLDDIDFPRSEDTIVCCINFPGSTEYHITVDDNDDKDNDKESNNEENNKTN